VDNLSRRNIDNELEAYSLTPIRPIGEEAGDYSIQIKIPGGFEYDEAEIAMATVLKGSGPIAFAASGVVRVGAGLADLRG